MSTSETRAAYSTTGIREFREIETLKVEEGVDLFAPQALLNSLSIIRAENTEQDVFRKHSDYIFQLLGARIAEELPTKTIEITTPLTSMKTDVIEGSNVLIVSILRSGHPASLGVRKAIPDASIGVVDIKRDEKTALPHMSYDGLEGIDLSGFSRIIVPDPMLATGGSADMAIRLLKNRDAKNIHLVSLVAAPDGINKIQSQHPDVKITTAAIDERLNDKKFIVPGLGDFGDRYFGTGETDIIDELNKARLIYRNGVLHRLVPEEGPSLF